MTTSGTVTWNLTADDFIVQAFNRLGKGDISGSDLRDARIAMNMLLIDLSNRDVLLWKVDLLALSLDAAGDEYTLPSTVDGVLDGVIMDGDGIEMPTTKLSLIEFNRIPKKTQTGRPFQYTVERNIDSTSIKFWPVPSSNDYTFNYFAVKRIEDVGSLRDTVDISYRFIPAIIFGLAYQLSFLRPGVDPNYRESLKLAYEENLMRARDDYRERVSWKFKPMLNIPR